MRLLPLILVVGMTMVMPSPASSARRPTNQRPDFLNPLAYVQSQITSTLDGLSKIFKFVTRLNSRPRTFSPPPADNNKTYPQQDRSSASDPFSRTETFLSQPSSGRVLADSGPQNFTIASDLYFGQIAEFQHWSGNYKYYANSEITMQQLTDKLNALIPTITGSAACMNGGNSHVVDINLYICNGSYVTKAEYEASKASLSCIIEKHRTRMCYCPRDYFGTFCQYRLPLFCRYDWVSPSNAELHCNKSAAQPGNVKYYDDRRFGQAPCVFAYNRYQFNLTARLQCLSHPLATEGFKTLAQYVRNDTTKVTETFNYWINTTSIGVTDAIPMLNLFSILNFNAITDFAQTAIMSNGDSDLITGKKTLTFSINLLDLRHLRYGGRWYFEAFPGAFAIGYGSVLVGATTRAAIDDPTYIEPSTHTSMKWWVILIIVLGSVIGATIVVLATWVYCRKRKEEKELME